MSDSEASEKAAPVEKRKRYGADGAGDARDLPQEKRLPKYGVSLPISVE